MGLREKPWNVELILWALGIVQIKLVIMGFKE